ncbi:MAG: SOS response-associated peptidase [Chloroflexota bacterium]
MCGRFALFLDPADLAEAFPEYTFPAQVAPRYNIAPTQPILAVPNDGSDKADFFVWGLIPSWAKDPSIGNRLINARAETLAEKPAFRAAYKYRRCVIFASGFYEWQARPGTKTKVPHFIHLKSGEPFAFAGLWERWEAPDGSEVRSAAIITTEPNELMRPLHNRMPVILSRLDLQEWLDPTPRFPVDLKSLLVPFPADEMEAYPISTLVNSPGNDRPEILEKV